MFLRVNLGLSLPLQYLDYPINDPTCKRKETIVLQQLSSMAQPRKEKFEVKT
ncbi:hypothetical protein Syun_006411 [Stephania yunnanensis]|uniref:Uncharacterized protein n=1 Tax=Stephania yunnanensis TaxID=152371 RepID=A0AAP0KXJ5_9MAGN